MKRHVAMLRTLALLAALGGLAAFTTFTRDWQEPCTAITPSTTCTISGFNAYFSSDASGTINGDTVNLNLGALYMTPDNGPNQAARKPHVRMAYTTPAGNMAYVLTRPADDPASPATSTYLNISYTSSAVVALLQGTLGQPSTLQPGCQITYPSGTVSNIPNPDSLLTWFGTEFSITIPNYPSPNCN